MSETIVTADTIIDNNDDLDAFAADLFGERKAADTPAKAEVEQDDPVVDEPVEDTEAQKTNDELTDEDEEAAEAELAEEKPKSRVEQRISELVKQREDAKREADAKIEAMRQEFEARINALQPKAVEKTVSEPSPDVLNEDGTPKYPLGEFDPTYIRDLTRYTLEQERAQAEIKAQERQQLQREADEKATLIAGWNEKMVSVTEKYPDFKEKGSELLGSLSNLDQSYADYIGSVLMGMEYGPDVLYYLSTNRDEAAKIVNSGAQRATLALGRIEAKFAEVDAQKQLVKPKLSKAPVPPSVTARGTGGGSRSISPDTDDLEAFSSVFFTKRK